jgi:hypothetical protein
MAMTHTCLRCHKKIDEQYRVNEFGEIFCGDDCYDCYYEENGLVCNDWKHPYIDDYELIRSNYLDWLGNWESGLDVDPEFNNIQHHVDDLLDKLDEVYEEYWDYFKTEGNDEVFAREIYMYLLKFQQLQDKLLRWRPKHEVYYYLSLELSCEDNDGVINDWDTFAKYLYHIQALELYEMLKDQVHPYDILAFYFKTEEELDAAIQKLEQTFHDDIYIYSDKAYRCEGECADIEVIANIDIDDQDGWFFCDSCLVSYYPGFFTIEELQKEIQVQDELPDFKRRSKIGN